MSHSLINQNLYSGKQLFLENNREIIEKIIGNHFNINLTESKFIAIEHGINPFEEKDIECSHTELNFYFDKASDKELWFYFPIYSSSSGLPPNLKSNIPYFNDYYKKIVALLSAFYKNIEIVYMIRGKTGVVLKDGVPNFLIDKENIRILGTEPLYDKIRDAAWFLIFNHVNFKSTCVTNNFIDLIFSRYNEYIVPKNSEIELNMYTDIEILKKELMLIAMMII